MKKKFSGILIVLSGPSGVGKGTVIKQLLKKIANLKISVSVTTREPRDGEENGKEYFFTDKQNFLTMIENSEFLEYAEYCGNFYGTPKKKLLDMLNNGNDVILEIDVEGAFQIKKIFSDAISIFIAPISEDTLKYRLLNRGSDNETSINERINRAKKEIECANDYDYLVENVDLEKCVEDISKIIEVEHMKTKRLSYIVKEG